MNKVLTRVILLGGLLAGVFVLSALAEEFLFRSTISGSNPNTVIGGVPSGGAPWTVHRGAAALTGDGRLRVEIAGLILVNLGTPGPVKSVSGSLVCGGTGGSVVATTDAVPLSPEGDAEVESRVNFNDSTSASPSGNSGTTSVVATTLPPVPPQTKLKRC